MELLYTIKKRDVIPADTKAMKIAKMMTADLQITPRSKTTIPITSFSNDSDGSVHAEIHGQKILVIPHTDIHDVYENRKSICDQILAHFYQDDSQSKFFNAEKQSQKKNSVKTVAGLKKKIEKRISKKFSKKRNTIPITHVSMTTNPYRIYVHLPAINDKVCILDETQVWECMINHPDAFSEIAGHFHFVEA